MSKGRSVQRLESEGPRNMLILVGFLLPHLRGQRAESSTVEKEKGSLSWRGSSSSMYLTTSLYLIRI